MDFRKATELLCEPVTHADIAKAVKRSEQTVRQARLPGGSAGHRSPPPDWEGGIAKLARARADKLLKLADQLQS
jgi:hypothetical protein